jgi:hypothetical protein
MRITPKGILARNIKGNVKGFSWSKCQTCMAELGMTINNDIVRR